MRRAALVSCLLGWLVVALANPGCGSSGGGVDCTATPDAPICEGFVATSDAVGDRGSVSGTSGDAIGADASCTGTRQRCVGNQAQQCQGGAFVTVETCTNPMVCEFGSCVPAGGCSCVGKVCGDDGCGNICGTCTGNTICDEGQCVSSTGGCSCAGRNCGDDGCGGSCGTCAPGSTCSPGGQCAQDVVCSCGGALCGVDNCGNSCGTCGGGSACVAGQCVPVGGGADSCLDLLSCVIDGCLDLPEAEAAICEETCQARGSATAQSQYAAYVGCANNCGSDSFCFASQCNTQQAACFFQSSGQGSCIDIINCFDGCATGDGACIEGCYLRATPAAQAALLGLNACLNAACPEPSPESCIDSAFAGLCAGHVAACQSN